MFDTNLESVRHQTTFNIKVNQCHESQLDLVTKILKSYRIGPLSVKVEEVQSGLIYTVVCQKYLEDIRLMNLGFSKAIQAIHS